MRFCGWKNRWLRGLWLLLVLCFCGTAGRAQRYPFYNISIENGLIQSQAACLAQDASGYLWIGTVGGLSRYDGRSVISYSVRDGLPGNSINALRVDHQNKLWLGTSKGLSSFDGRSFRQFQFQSKENPFGNEVRRIEIMPDNTIWCVAGNELYTLRDNKIKSIPLPGNGKRVSAILADRENRLLVAVQDAGVLYTLRGEAWDSIPLPQPIYINRMYEDRQRQIWLLSNHGLYRLSGRQFVPPSIDPRKLKDLPALTSMTQANDDSYWFGSVFGAVHLTDSTVEYYDKRNGFTDNNIFAVMTDAEGNIWFASDGQGIFRFSGAPFVALDESMGLPSAQVMGVAADAGGKLFLGTYDAGLFSYKDGHVSAIPFPVKPVPRITALTVFQNEEWIGTRANGAWRYQHGALKNVDFQGQPGKDISALFSDGDSILWIGYLNGAAFYRNGVFQSLPFKTTSVFDFARLGNDSMLMATTDGLKLYSNHLILPFTTGTITDSISPLCLTLSPGKLWIGSDDDGIIYYDFKTGRSQTIDKRSGLHSDFIYNLFTDKKGTIWAGTGFGIHSIYLDEEEKPVVTFYGKGQGVTGMESNTNAVFGMADGSIWFGTTNGAVHYQPAARMTSVSPASIVLQRVLLFGEAITDSSYFDGTTPLYNVPINLRLPYRKNNLTFTFHAISLSDREHIRYRYRMEKLDAQWSDWATATSITYSALPPGRYVFHVQCSTDGSTPIRDLNYEFEIITPFQKTNLFLLLVLLACILLGVSLQYAANRRKLNRQRLIEALRREEQSKVRQRTAEDFHDEVGNKLTRINVLTNVLKSKLGAIPPDAERIIGQIQDNTGQLYSGTRDILWALKPTNDNLYEILHRIRDFGRDLFGDTDIDFEFTGTDESWRNYRLQMDMSRNLIMIFKEALNNCLKYSNATKVLLEATILADGRLQLRLTDNGIGFDVEKAKRGHGIDNMNVRTRRLDGTMHITSIANEKTVLELIFKIPQSKA